MSHLLPEGGGAGRRTVVRHGTVVTAVDGVARDLGVSDVVIRDGVIEAVGMQVADDDVDEIIDATGCFVVPGALDLHVHLSATAPDPGAANGFVDDFDTGTACAAAGGVTTVGQMSFAEDGWSLQDALDRDAAAIARDARVDVMLIPGLITPTEQDVALIPELAADGYPALKVVDPSFGGDRRRVEAAIEAAGRAGMLTLVHCEDADLIGTATAELIRCGNGGLEHFGASRPVASEVASVEWAVGVVRRTGAPMVLVHVSSAAALAVATAARRDGLPVFVETRPMYLHLTDEVFTGADPGRFTGMPPVRSGADVATLWAAIADGRVDTVASDHAPWRLPDKTDPALDVASARMGVADLQTLVPMLFSAGVATGRIPVTRFVELTSARAARLYGLRPRKGAIVVGAAADLMILDPAAQYAIAGAEQLSAAGYSVYEGTAVRGAVRRTLLRGEAVFADGRVVGPAAAGQQVRRTSSVGSG